MCSDKAEFSLLQKKTVFLCLGQPKRQFGTRLKEHQKAVFFWDNSKIITTYWRYYQRLCLEAGHINSAHAPLSRDNGGLLPDAYLHLVN